MKAKKTVSMKALVILMAAVLLVGGAVGGTLAWLIAGTNTVTNTFTVGDINIDLTETVGDEVKSALTDKVTNDGFKVVPGTTQSKDPQVTVKAGSENCYVFVKIEESNTKIGDVTYVEWAIADGWTKLTGVDGVYYREYTADTDMVYSVLKDDKVSYPSELTKAQLNALGTNTPTLSFTAYAVQKEGMNGNVATAWAEVAP